MFFCCCSFAPPAAAARPQHDEQQPAGRPGKHPYDAGLLHQQLHCSQNAGASIHQHQPTHYSAAIVTECSELVSFSIYLPFFPSFTKDEARRKGLRTEQAGPLPHSRGRFCRCQESTGGDPDHWYGEHLYSFFFFLLNKTSGRQQSE